MNILLNVHGGMNGRFFILKTNRISLNFTGYYTLSTTRMESSRIKHMINDPPITYSYGENSVVPDLTLSLIDPNTKTYGVVDCSNYDDNISDQSSWDDIIKNMVPPFNQSSFWKIDDNEPITATNNVKSTLSFIVSALYTHYPNKNISIKTIMCMIPITVDRGLEFDYNHCFFPKEIIGKDDIMNVQISPTIDLKTLYPSFPSIVTYLIKTGTVKYNDGKEFNLITVRMDRRAVSKNNLKKVLQTIKNLKPPNTTIFSISFQVIDCNKKNDVKDIPIFTERGNSFDGIVNRKFLRCLKYIEFSLYEDEVDKKMVSKSFVIMKSKEIPIEGNNNLLNEIQYGGTPSLKEHIEAIKEIKNTFILNLPEYNPILIANKILKNITLTSIQNTIWGKFKKILESIVNPTWEAQMITTDPFIFKALSMSVSDPGETMVDPHDPSKREPMIKFLEPCIGFRYSSGCIFRYYPEIFKEDKKIDVKRIDELLKDPRFAYKGKNPSSFHKILATFKCLAENWDNQNKCDNNQLINTLLKGTPKLKFGSISDGSIIDLVTGLGYWNRINRIPRK